MAPTVETFTAGATTAVDVAQVERELRQLWQLAGDSSSQRITRACLFNLVAYCESAADHEHVTGVLSEITGRHPCRAIVLLAEPDAPADSLDAAISAHCHLAGGGGKQVCCEQISIHATGKSVTRLAGAVLPLLESDLPTVLWWYGNILARPELFQRLRTVADRVVFDSAATELPALAAVIDDRCADLGWTRLALWQQLLAEAFVPGVDAAEIVHGCGPGARQRGELLAGWLTAQLGPGLRVSLTGQEDRDSTTVGLIAVTLRGAGAEICVRKNHGERTASVVVNVPGACGLPRKRALWPTDDAALLNRELDQPSAPGLYRRALAFCGRQGR